MAMSLTLQHYLNGLGVDYDVLPHPYTTTSMDTAQAGRIPGDRLAKSVILEDENGYLMVVIPATHHIALGRLSNQLNRHLGLATEQELGALFPDCDLGAIPPVGSAYGMDVVVDEELAHSPDVYFEAGDHTDVVHVEGEAFRALMRGARHGHFSQHL
jgi:Ala-tRNA(Pro) deacylase